jgi:predicted dehydrogenase
MNIGVIGAGKISQKHVDALVGIEEVDYIGVTDKKISRASKVTSKSQASLVESSDKIFSIDKIDAVSICTPVQTHRDLIVEALENDKHVFCEKPLCDSLEDALKIKELSEKKGKVVTVGYLYRFHPAMRELKRIVDEGIIGEVHYSNFRLGGRGSHRAWKHSKEKGGGVLNEISVHKIDLINWILGDINGANKLVHKNILSVREIGGKDVKVDANDVMIASFEAEKSEAILNTDIFTSGFIEFVELMGTNGSAFGTILDYIPNVITLSEARGGYDSGRNLERYEYVDLFEKQFERFFEVIEGKSNNLNSVSSSIKILKAVESLSGHNT